MHVARDAIIRGAALLERCRLTEIRFGAKQNLQIRHHEIFGVSRCYTAPSYKGIGKMRRKPLPPPEAGVKPRLVKIKTAAVYLAKSPCSIRGLVQTGRLRYIPGDGPAAPWLFDARELDAFIEREQQCLPDNILSR